MIYVYDNTKRRFYEMIDLAFPYLLDLQFCLAMKSIDTLIIVKKCIIYVHCIRNFSTNKRVNSFN